MAVTGRRDLVLHGGAVIDGTGAPSFAADVVVHDGHIDALVEPGTAPDCRQRVDCRGLVVSPGFIDVHTHDDRVVLDHPEMLPKLTQGVTTVVTGNCGISLAPLQLRDGQAPPAPLNLLGPRDAFAFSTLADYRRAVDLARPTVNVAALVGHSTLRVHTMRDPLGKASPDERAQMRAMLEQAVDAGASGFSTGLFYATNRAADIEEVAELAALVGRTGGVYATHLRDEFAGVLDALEESFTTARVARVPLIISHHKCAGHDNWGRSSETLAAIEAAAANQAIGLDAYPYHAGSTVLLPELIDGRIEVQISDCPAQPELRGRMLADIAALWQCDQREAAQRIVPASAIYFQMHETDVRRILAHPRTMIGSDGLPGDAHPHPRLWGTFPRVLGHYCRDEALFDLETAIHKMTGRSATNFRLSDRGELSPGKVADLTVFDPRIICDTATFERPISRARGIAWVIVAGEITLDPHGTVHARAGRFLART